MLYRDIPKNLSSRNVVSFHTIFSGVSHFFRVSFVYICPLQPFNFKLKSLSSTSSFPFTSATVYLITVSGTALHTDLPQSTVLKGKYYWPHLERRKLRLTEIKLFVPVQVTAQDSTSTLMSNLCSLNRWACCLNIAKLQLYCNQLARV